MQHRNRQTDVVFYTRKFCPLCLKAEPVVTEVCEASDAQLRIIDIDNPPPEYDRADLQTKYSDYVPVVTVNGVQQGFWRIDADHLARAIAKTR